MVSVSAGAAVVSTRGVLFVWLLEVVMPGTILGP
jgi:hypothetical protein